MCTKLHENLPSGSKVISGGPTDRLDFISLLPFLESRLKGRHDGNNVGMRDLRERNAGNEGIIEYLSTSYVCLKPGVQPTYEANVLALNHLKFGPHSTTRHRHSPTTTRHVV
jgi:hypothetical protein